MTKSNGPMTALLLLKRLDCDNGVTSYCETIMQGIKDHGDRVIFITGPIAVTPATQARLDNMMRLADEWLTLPELPKISSTLHCFHVISQIIRQRRVDVVSPQGFFLLPLCKLLQLRTGVPIVMNFHGGAASHRGKEGSLKERLYYQSVSTLFGARKYISISNEVTKFMKKVCGIKPTRIAHIPHGIDVQYFSPPTASDRAEARTTFGISENALVCVLPGWVSETKGHRLVVAAVRSLRASNPEITIACLFAGSTKEGPEIIEDSLKDDEDRKAFKFLGFINREQLRKTYWAADIVILPSLFEGFPIAFVEGMACGCIAIRTPAGGSSDQVIDHVTGFVVPFGDSSAIANRLLLLNDPVKRNEMREAARARAVAHFSKEQMVASTIKVFSDTYTTA